MYLYFLFYTTMSECMIFYGPTVPEINYSSSSSSIAEKDGKLEVLKGWEKRNLH